MKHESYGARVHVIVVLCLPVGAKKRNGFFDEGACTPRVRNWETFLKIKAAGRLNKNDPNNDSWSMRYLPRLDVF